MSKEPLHWSERAKLAHSSDYAALSAAPAEPSRRSTKKPLLAVGGVVVAVVIAVVVVLLVTSHESTATTLAPTAGTTEVNATAEYMNAVKDIGHTLDGAFHTVDDWLHSTAPPGADVLAAIRAIKEQRAVAQKLVPPPKSEDGHDYLLQALSHYARGMDLLTEAIDKNGEPTEGEIGAAMTAGDADLNRCTELLKGSTELIPN